jgi:hypothetical protein
VFIPMEKARKRGGVDMGEAGEKRGVAWGRQGATIGKKENGQDCLRRSSGRSLTSSTLYAYGLYARATHLAPCFILTWSCCFNSASCSAVLFSFTLGGMQKSCRMASDDYGVFAVCRHVKRAWNLWNGQVSVADVQDQMAVQVQPWDLLYLKGHQYPGFYGESS